MGTRVALAHDYLTQRGGAERVLLAMGRAFPGAVLHTALYDATRTYPELTDLNIEESPLGKIPGLRARHRYGLPAYATTFGRMRPDADVVLCSSSGWAHGIGGDAPKIVYCYTPARWLYRPADFAPGRATRLGMGVLGPTLRRWDARQAHAAQRYLTTSPGIAARIAAVYGIEAEVLPPPPGLVPSGPQEAVAGVGEGIVLCVSRLLPYKHVDLLVAAAGQLDMEVVVVGEGPEWHRLRATAPFNVRFMSGVTDSQLRWLYGRAAVLAAPAEEDYGLTPVEAAGFGVPTVARRFGGHLMTVADGTTGILVADPTPTTFARALEEATAASWDGARLRAHAADHAEPAFARRLREVVDEVLADGR